MELLDSLLLPYNGRLVRLSSLSRLAGDQRRMAAAAVASSPFSSQEQHNLPIRQQLDANPFNPPPSAQPTLTNNNPLQISDSGFANLQSIEELFGPQESGASDEWINLPNKKQRTANKVKLQLRGDKQGIQPQYTVEEVCQQFTGKVSYASENFEAAGLFPSKDDARDAAAKVALDQLPSLPSKQIAGTKRKSSSPTPVDKSENWIGVLTQNYAQSKAFEPEFGEKESKHLPPRFFCEVQLNGGPIEVFNAGIFTRKQDAKSASAKLAVEWLRRAGHQVSPTKRAKPCPGDGHTGLTQAVDDVRFDDTKPKSFRQRVYELAVALGFQQPSFSLANAMSGGSIYDVAAIFKPVDVEREPALAGAIGQVDRVFGKDNAKEACCERVLPVLEAIKQKRLAGYQA